MENIFEGAKLGDKFLTEDGRLAVYISRWYDGTKDMLAYPHILHLDGVWVSHETYFNDEGQTKSVHGSPIVSRYDAPKDLMERFAALPGLDEDGHPVYGKEGYDNRDNYIPTLSKWLNGDGEVIWTIMWENFASEVIDSIEVYSSLEETIAAAEELVGIGRQNRR